MFSKWSSSSISLAMVTPSLVMVGAPQCLGDDDVAALGAQRHLYRVGQLVDAGFEAPAGGLVELELLRHYFFTLASTSRLDSTSRSSPSMVTSVPPYFE